MTFPQLKMPFHQWFGHMEEQDVAANLVANTRGRSQSRHVIWLRVQLIQASHKRDEDQKKQRLWHHSAPTEARRLTPCAWRLLCTWNPGTLGAPLRY